MAEDPGGLMNGKDAVHGVSFYLDLIEYAPSEHAKTVIINEKLVPWTQSKDFLSLDVAIILEYIIPKYAAFQTRTLLTALHALFDGLYSINKTTFLASAVRGLDAAITHALIKANAISNYFTLLDWVNHFLVLSNGDHHDLLKYLPDLARWQAILLQHCLAEPKKRGLRISARRTTRASLRAIFQQKDTTLSGVTTESFIKILVGSKIPPFAAAVSLGVVAGVCKRLRHDNAPSEFIEQSKNVYYDFFIKEIIGSKVRIPSYVMDEFRWFFEGYTSQSDFATVLSPALERGILRSPELVLIDIVPFLCSALRPEIDLSETVSQKILPQLISSLKSTNVTIRDASQNATKVLLARCHNPEALQKIAEGLLKSLKDERSVDTRVSIARILEGLPKSSTHLSAYITQSLTPLFAKETNEMVLSALIDGLMAHQGVLLGNDSALDDKVSKLITSGLTDKRGKFKSSWTVAISGVIWNIGQSPANSFVIKFSNSIAKHMFNAFNEAASNAVQASQNGTIISGYAVSAAALGRWLSWQDDQLAQLVKSDGILNITISVTPKLSFLLNDRIYTRLTTEREQLWAIRALEATATRALTEMETAWSLAAIFFIANPKLPRTVRSAAKSMIENILVTISPDSRSKAADIIISGLEEWLRQIEGERKEGPAVAVGISSLRFLKEVVTSILSPKLLSETSYLQDVLQRLFVLAHHPRLPRHQWSWIDISRKIHIDPGQLTGERTNAFLDAIKQKFCLTEKSSEFQEAAFAACGTLAFISPEKAIPILVGQIKEDLAPEVFNWITATDLQIWKAPEGTVVVDVLQKQTNGVANRAGKSQKKGDWDAELRAELEKKKGLATKLSPKDQALVNEQLSKESAIRSRVEEARQIVTSGLGIVQNLIKIPSNLGIELWYSTVLATLLSGVVQKCGGLVGSMAVDSYLDMSNLTSARLGYFKIPVAIALLRTLQVPEVPEDWMQEPLDDLSLRVLYRLRFLSEQHPLDLTSFQFCLPFALEILNAAHQSEKERGEAEEKITLALEFLSFQAALCDNTSLPRIHMIQALLDVLLLIPAVHKLARDTFLQITDAISANETKEEVRVLVHGLLKPLANVRNVVLQGLEPFELDEIENPEILFLALHDSDERNAELSLALYEANSLSLDSDGLWRLFALLEHEIPYVRQTAAKALATALPALSHHFNDYIDKLIELYEEKAKPVPPKYDKYGLLIKTDTATMSPGKIRLSVGLAFERLGPVIPTDRVEDVLHFLINREALGDSDGDVRDKMLTAGLVLIESHGKQKLEGILNILNRYLDAPAKSSEIHDRVREATVILLGAAARHLNSADPRTDSVIDKLLVTLKTPSESVQFAVCDCLPPLIRARSHRVNELIPQLMDSLTSSSKYAERRGAAFGIAGVVSGAGIGTLYNSDVLSRLASAISSRKDAKSREGVLFAYEALLYSLGRLFEPFVTQILPYLLVTYGDSATEVRNATSDTAKMVMQTISGHCVKEILPSLLAGLEEPQWRSKKGSIEMLGAMAYLAPKQLSISLPTVVPRLTGVLTDSHTQVRSAANSSLLKFGEVISNPEIQDMVPILLKALGDPNKSTEAALDKLLSTAFIHYIDGPSLALILPIITRGLKERNATTRRKSARILGSLGNLTDQSDLITYLTELLPPLRDILSDAIPENRSSAATSLGLLVEKLGEDSFPDLIDSLMDDLKVETGGIGRLGSAQALSEILSALGLHRLEDVLPDILASTESIKAAVREAFINLLVYLPATFGNRFQPYLAQTVPKILMGLADDVDAVREASLRAGRIVVTNYAIKAVDILLPELEKAFFDDRWQIRHSSVELVGSMMYQLVGINKRPEGEDEDIQEEATETQRAALVEVLGQERRDRILSALYIARQDISGIVRIAAAQVFKTLVSNPQKMVREMLPTMTNMIVKNLASADEERRQGSARTLGDIVRKFGQGTLSELLPVLQEGLHSHDAVHVQGICIALVEIMNSASKEGLENFQDVLCDAVREALRHPNPRVQKAAAETFEALQQQFPSKAIESIIPTLLRQLESDIEAESETALVALREIMKGRSNARILGSLLPSLTAVPVSPVNAKALSSLAEAAGSAIYPRLAFILQNLMDSLIAVKDTDWVDSLTKSFNIIILSVDEDEGIRIVLTTLFSALKHENPRRRAFAISQAGAFFRETDEDFSRYASQWATVLVNSFAERDIAVVQSAIQTLTAMTTKLQPDELEACVIPVRQAVLSVGVEGHDLPGFTQPGGLTGVFAIYLAGLKRSSAEEAAHGIAEMVLRTNLNSLKPVTVQMIGALIRAIGERHPAAGKTAILHALVTLLVKAPLFAKPFIPQLQRTAVKNLSDPANSDVRNQAAVVLGALIPMQPRVDPLVTELIGAAIAAPDDGVKFATLKALCEVLSRAGKLVGDPQKTALTVLIHQTLLEGRGQIVAMACRLMSLLLKLQSAESAMTLIHSEILDSQLSKNSVVALNGLLFDPPGCVLDMSIMQEITEVSLNAAQNTDDTISESGILALGKIITNETIPKDEESVTSIFNVLARIIQSPPSGSTDSQRLSLVVVRTTSRKSYELIRPHVQNLVAPVLTCARDSIVLPLKLAAERAYMAMFQMESQGTTLLDKMLGDMDAPLKKSVQEYTKRIAGKIAALENMDHEELAEDEIDDETEINSVGGMTF